MAGIIQGENSALLAVAKGVNINSAASDVAIVNIPAAKYVVRRVIFVNPSLSLAASVATLGVFTAAAGGGTTVVAAATMTGLTAASKYLDRTLAAGILTDVLTAAQLFIRCVLAHGSPATIDVYVFGEVLP